MNTSERAKVAERISIGPSRARRGDDDDDDGTRTRWVDDQCERDCCKSQQQLTEASAPDSTGRRLGFEQTPGVAGWLAAALVAVTVAGLERTIWYRLEVDKTIFAQLLI
jgi:hypothetical protein